MAHLTSKPSALNTSLAATTSFVVDLDSATEIVLETIISQVV